jgi:2-dehydro-3-deoxy-D-arabinonate dehydratase
MYRVFRDGADAVIDGPAGAVRVAGWDFDAPFRAGDPAGLLADAYAGGQPVAGAFDPASRPWDPPLGNQEVWAAGVTYLRSRTARMEESERSGGDRFYDLVYEAGRPELFFKATARRVRGHLAGIRVRADSTWDVPEPELALAVSTGGKVFGYSVGNDVSSRSIEGENPLYLPQAKVYTGSCALGPALVVPGAPLPDTTTIELRIARGGADVFSGATALDQMKRSPDELAEWLFRENDFPDGAYLLTGTGVVPGDGFTLRSGDTVSIRIAGVGELVNQVE